MLLVADGGVVRVNGAGGIGLQYLADAIENLSYAVAYLAQKQS